ncbi:MULTISPECIES: tripartite tricarboxylate transporter TctB family protein [unclassified Bosea (in: a-proteobacteria)]|uniref:tripartite tricarboxylate transporter TctB family protein n=1 Tax=unclassified Bosea (in: a-proteobacteria) TaxID=2653178 RepID=UPI0009560860|nr:MULTISPECIES: tripartite tricarboxylate transporter TctB family protein [unclassified Bosea (in: a-proteobacteria)]TAJ34316.1 MAG: tripartite tricarboxylate transporter TctB family protein [Bosea sp. (in: a-proteobacteria)]SIP99470.1 putative tricarboxylic transport membrane protein [Bosea sp. TND4EK4]
MTNETRARGADKPALIVGVLLLAVAFLVGYDAAQQTIVSTYGIGPTAMPYVVATGLVILGLAHFVTAFRGGLPQPEAADTGALLWIAGGLVGLIGCIALGGGFVIAIALLFSCTARGMGRRAFAVDVAIGFGLGLAIFLTFAKLLTLILPSGPLERLFL